jgi:hypothetical protein
MHLVAPGGIGSEWHLVALGAFKSCISDFVNPHTTNRYSFYRSPIISMNTTTTTWMSQTLLQSPTGTIIYIAIAVFVIILLYIG